MKELIKRMNDVLTDWKAKFDVMSNVQMEFRLNENGRLCLNENEIHMPDNLVLSSAEFDAEDVKFYFEGTKKILAIGIVWPEDETPKVDTIRFGYESKI